MENAEPDSAISSWLDATDSFGAPSNQTWEIPELHGGCWENHRTKLNEVGEFPAIDWFDFSGAAAGRQSEVNMSLAAPIAGFVVGC